MAFSKRNIQKLGLYVVEASVKMRYLSEDLPLLN